MLNQWTISSCSVIAQTQYKSKHDNVAKLIHYELAKQEDFQLMISGGFMIPHLYRKIILPSRLTGTFHIIGQTLYVSIIIKGQPL